jgi:hypothetical protein
MFKLWKNCALIVINNKKVLEKLVFFSTNNLHLIFPAVQKTTFSTIFKDFFSQLISRFFNLLYAGFSAFYTAPTITTNYLIKKGKI